jgi:hypothetical protein
VLFGVLYDTGTISQRNAVKQRYSDPESVADEHGIFQPAQSAQREDECNEHGDASCRYSDYNRGISPTSPRADKNCSEKSRGKARIRRDNANNRGDEESSHAPPSYLLLRKNPNPYPLLGTKTLYSN